MLAKTKSQAKIKLLLNRKDNPTSFQNARQRLSTSKSYAIGKEVLDVLEKQLEAKDKFIEQLLDKLGAKELHAPKMPSLLSLVPYPFLPPTNGGHLGIAEMHRHLARLCEDHVAGVKTNAPKSEEPFHLHKIFDPGAARYLPFRYNKELIQLGREKRVEAVFCEHPYMAITANAVARTLKIPWFLRSHNIESERFRTMGKPWWPVLARYERWAMTHSKGTFFVTAEDAEWTQTHWNIPAEKCHVAPYGTPLSAPPAPDAGARERLAAQLNLNPDVPWLYFLGALDYRPNAEAVDYLLHEVQPRLLQSGAPFEMLIAGKGLSEEQREQLAARNIHYTGFLPSLDDFLHACDVMLNPVLTGGGIKTKAVEALAWGKRVVSCHSGAAGLERTACGDALFVSPDGDWNGFVRDILAAMKSSAVGPTAFYEKYYWGKVAEGVLQTMFHVS